MALNRHRNRPKDLRGMKWGACVYLLDGPKTMEQLSAAYGSAPFPVAQPYGFNKVGQWNKRGIEKLPGELSGLLSAGWVIQEGNQYSITEFGRNQLDQILANASTSTQWIIRKLHTLFHPAVAAKLTLIVQIILALIKLPAGILSGSVALLNDSADTILDLISSVLVYLGIRFNKERLVSILLVVFMLGTAGFTLFEAIKRLLTPYIPRVDWFPFAAAVLSALAGFILWTYQRYIGIQNGLMPFIAESVDSRSHVIVALGVTAGLIGSLLNFGLLDMLVGLVVAVLILWSAIQLVVDLWRSSVDEKVDLSHYGFWLLNVYEHLRDTHLRDWMLYLVDHREVQTRGELVERAQRAFDYRDNRWMKMVGLDRQFAPDPIIEQTLDEIFRHGWVIDQDPLIISLEGKEHLKKQRKQRRTHQAWVVDERKLSHDL
jgi:Co/Zn/Cd efflux system component